jgi:hypothetical protein
MGRRLRTRIGDAIRAQQATKVSGLPRLMGCSIEFFRSWIEHNFERGMTWANWGNMVGCWHLDHLFPCASFDLSDPAQQKECFHWSNIFPMWAAQNIKKSDKIYIPDYQI